jgi:general secretion pathway protein E
MPSVFGEDAVLRILDKQTLSDQLCGLTLDSLGYNPDLLTELRKLSTKPYGMLLVTGPTGSGKTTTLYAVISEVNKGLDKIITIEDPVEYQLPGVLQIPVNEQKGLTFARGLRSILRHDPDRTTVHANNVFDVLGRFMHMGVDTYNFVSALNAVLAQRLLRLVCRECAEPQRVDDAMLAASRIDPGERGHYRFMHGRGCVHCRGTGYKGRKAIGELLVMDDDLRELIVAREPVRKLKEAARAAGTIPLRDAALELVKAGETTLEEINRVTFVA